MQIISIKAITLLLICAYTLGCSSGQSHQQYQIDAEFEPFVAEFVLQARKYDASIHKLKHVQIYFADSLPTPNALGVCYTGYKDYDIIVLRSYWQRASHYSKEQLIMHELGHCVLGRSHKNGFMPVDNQMKPLSIMNQYHLPDEAYISFRDELIFELFSY